MAFYDKFPYTNFQEINLDTIMEKTTNLEEYTTEAKEAATQATTAANTATTAAAAAEASAENAATSSQSIPLMQRSLSLLENRVDEIIKVETGTAENTELIDIRTAYNGQQYTTAGNAVRGQVSELHEDITEFNNLLMMDIGNIASGVQMADSIYYDENGVAVLNTFDGYVTGEIIFPTTASYLTVNSYYFNNSFSFYCDINNRILGRVQDYQTDLFVYEVPANTAKIRYSYNWNTALKTIFNEKGIVVLLNKSTSITGYSSADHPYDTKNYYADNLRMKSSQDMTLQKRFVGVPIVFSVRSTGVADFTTLKDAINYINNHGIFDAKVYLNDGLYDLESELGSNYLNNVSSSQRGLVLKNRVHIIGTANTVIQLYYTGTRDATREWLSAFNAGPYGFTLENVRIRTRNIRYAIHDDLAGSSIKYYNIYKNCTITHHNGFYNSCIGGGIGENGVITIENCYFECDSTPSGNNRCVYYHGNSTSGLTTAVAFMYVRNCYFGGDATFALVRYGDSTANSIAYVSGNKFGAEPYVSDGTYAPQNNMTLRAWNNIIL